MDRYIGRMLDNRYEILEVIGSGGMAVVYKARCHRLNRLVAIKILKDENLQDQDFRRRFHAESQAVAMLSHPNIVSVHDVSMDKDEDYIVMELIEGISLKQYMEKRGVLNWKETLHFAMQIAKALDHAHGKELVHRDIKPHNVMVLRTGAVKVADFGIARMMSKSNTLTKEALGSVHYISPEQARGGRVDNRSDIYSLGVVMYEMITGQVPFEGESPVSVAIQHINGGAVKPSQLNPGIPEALEQIILKAMATDPADRYADAAEMLQDMDEFRKAPGVVLIPHTPPQEETDAKEETTDPEEQEILPVPPAKKKSAPKPTRQKQEQDYAAAVQRRTTISTVTIVICSLLIVVAVIFSLSLLLRDNNGEGQTATVKVPALEGMYYSRLPDYDGIEIEVHTVYSSEYREGQIVRQEPQAGEDVAYGTKVFISVSMGPKPTGRDVRMINLVGYTEDSARQWLLGQGVNEKNIKTTREYSSTVAAGCVISTNPAVNESLPEDDKVTLVISMGPEMGIMPDLLTRTRTLEYAKSKMDEYGFKNVHYVPVNSEAAAGTVVAQSVTPGTSVALDSRIVIQYSNGIPPTIDPGKAELMLTELPLMEESYLLSVVCNSEILLLDYVMLPGQNSCQLTMPGFGVWELQIYVNGVLYNTVTVSVTANG